MNYEIEEIHSIECIGEFSDEYVYDIEVDDESHTFIGNDILVHNSCYLSFQEVLEKCNWSGTEKDFILKLYEYRLADFNSKILSKYAKELKADAIAHGSTGAGNDQVRFDMACHIIYPEAEIITPIRDQKLSREEEIAFLQKHGVEGNWEKSLYSVNQGIWGTSVGGKETLTSDKFLPDSAFPSQVTEFEPSEVTLTFENGEFVGLNGQKMAPVETIHALNKLGSKYGIGRDIHVGDTIVGIKGRVGFEASAPLIIIKAHHTLEKHTLTKWQLYWKEQLANWYGNLLHEGQFLDPVMRNIEAFLTDTQKFVTGEVRVRLNPNYFQVLGITSVHDLMNSNAAKYGETNTLWEGNDVRGFSKIAAVQNIIFNKVNGGILEN